MKIDWPLLQLDSTLGDPRDIQKIIDEPSQMRRLTLYHIDRHSPRRLRRNGG